MNLGEKLKDARIEAGITQEIVSQHLFVTRQTVSRWEQNRTLPNIHVLKELTELYGISMESLLSDKDFNVKETIEIKKVNIMALIGSILFNVFLFSGIAITLILLLVSLWVLVAFMTLSPVVLIWAILSGVQAFDWFDAILSAILLPGGIKLSNCAKKWTLSLIGFFRKYYRFNMKTIFQTYS